MKNQIPVVRYLLLAWLIVGVGGIMVFPFLSASSRAGLSGAFQAAQQFFLIAFLVCIAGYCIWTGRPTSAKRRSRQICADAYHALYAHFEQHSLEGPDAEKCAALRNTLEMELQRHIWFHPDDIRHCDIVRYRRYLQELCLTRSVW